MTLVTMVAPRTLLWLLLLSPLLLYWEVLHLVHDLNVLAVISKGMQQTKPC